MHTFVGWPQTDGNVPTVNKVYRPVKCLLQHTNTGSKNKRQKPTYVVIFVEKLKKKSAQRKNAVVQMNVKELSV